MSTKIRQMNFRASEEERTEIKQLAKQRDISVTELIVSSVRNVPLRDHAHEKQFIPYLLQLIKELHYVGNNINQVTVVIHQVDNGHRYPAEELAVFNGLLEKCIELKEILIKQFDERLYK